MSESGEQTGERREAGGEDRDTVGRRMGLRRIFSLADAFEARYPNGVRVSVKAHT